MLTMPEINYIKHLRQNEDLTISEIARKTGYNWRTAKKYADGEVILHFKLKPSETNHKQSDF